MKLIDKYYHKLEDVYFNIPVVNINKGNYIRLIGKSKKDLIDKLGEHLSDKGLLEDIQNDVHFDFCIDNRVIDTISIRECISLERYKSLITE